MGNLEKVIQLKQQGKTDQQITEELKQQGISPKEIEESLSQSQIKSAFNGQGVSPPQGVSSQQNAMNQQGAAAQQTPQAPKSTQEISEQSPQNPSNPSTTMQPSMMQSTPEALPQETSPPSPYPQTTQQTQEPPSTFQPAPLPMPQDPFQQAPQQEYPPEYQYSEYQPQQVGDIETINEIAEQIVDEKTTQLKKQIISFTKFKEETASDIERLNKRLAKIENTLNELQVAILRKVGDYGQEIQNIAKEMHTTQDSFSKILNPLTDNIRELQKITGQETPQSTKPKPKTKSSKLKSKKPKASFEDYLR